MPTPLTWPLAPSAPSTAPSASTPGGVSGSAPADYGVDVSTYPDLDDTFSSLVGIPAVAQSVARSLEDARRGVDLRQWLNEDLDEAALWRLQSSIEDRCLEDDRVSSASVQVTRRAGHALTISIALATYAQGPFRLVLQVSDLAVELLSVES